MAEWGPWIEHNGKGCPVDVHPGVYIKVRYRNGEIHAGRMNAACVRASNWLWPKSLVLHPFDVIAYCIRQPRGMAVLQELLAEVAEGVRA